MNTQRHLPYCT